MPEARATYEQVLCKISEAREHINKYSTLARFATTEEKYAQYLRMSLKATEDYNTWVTVRDALDRL